MRCHLLNRAPSCDSRRGSELKTPDGGSLFATEKVLSAPRKRQFQLPFGSDEGKRGTLAPKYQRGTESRRVLMRSAFILKFRINEAADPDRSKLRAVLEAEFAYERMATARAWFAHLLAVLGVVFWLAAIWPEFLPPGIRIFGLALFGGVLFLTLRAGIAEFVSQRKLKRCLDTEHGIVLRDPEEP